ncbi:MAG TPA: DUF1016 N-terminal domain-containing protein, partial [Flavisolibacter sp.]
MNKSFMTGEHQHISFSVLQEAIRQARYNALKTANAELVNLYWQVGAFVSKQLAQSTWGEKTVHQLSDFLKKQDPMLKGFDRKSIYRMVQFYESYRSAKIVSSVEPQIQDIENQTTEIVASMGRQLTNSGRAEFVTSVRRQIFEEDIRQTILAKISWTHNRTIFSRCKLEEEKEFYIRLSAKENYSVKELDRQISAGLFERTMIGNTRLSHSLTEKHPDILNSFKDSYVFEFLNLPESHSESDLQKGLIRQMK